MSKRVFVTGAAGFIGFHLAQALQARGDQVIGYDNFNSYYDPQLKRHRVSILKNLGIDVVEGDLCDPAKLAQSIDQHETTHIAHLAAQAGVRYSLKDPHAYLKSNIEGFVNILEINKNHPKIKLIYASSSSVYGLNKDVPFSIEQRTDHPVSLYGATKKTNELLAFVYHHLYGIAVTGLRFFTVYGPWGRPDMAYFSFTKAILEGRPIEVFNEGKMQRDFTYIDDIVQGTLAAIDLGAPCELFNLGNHRPEPLGLLIELIENELGIKAIKNHQPMQPGDVEATFADIEHSQRLLGFKPAVPLQVGISKFVHWYRQYEGC